MKQKHHDEETQIGRDQPTSTQGTEATGIHTTTIAMIFYHNYTGSLSTNISPDAAMFLAASGKTYCLQNNIMD